MKTPSNTLPSVLGSNVFGLAAWIAALFVFAALAISVAMMWRTSDALVKQVLSSLEHEAAAIGLEYRRHGIDRVRETIARKSEIAGPGLYLLLSETGQTLTGNLTEMPSGLRDQDRGGVFFYSARQGGSAQNQREAVALKVKLDQDGTVLLGRDIEDISAFARRMRMFLFLAFAGLTTAAIAAGYAISRAFLTRLRGINTTVHSIMQGDLSERVPLSGQHGELDGLARNLNQMLERIQQLMLSLREVSDNIAHDLKTPLNRLRNQAEGALRDPRGGEAYREGLERTIEEADGLIRTFNALLLIAKLEAGSLEESSIKFDVGEVLDDVSELYEPVAEEQGLSITTSAPQSLTVFGNKQLIVQAVANLIDNAIKYGSKVSDRRNSNNLVSAEARSENDLIVIEVGDHGPGIPEQDRQRALKRFVRLEQSRTEPGTGLGLSLVAAVARMHGGTVELDDNEPGLIVRLKLPCRAAAGHKMVQPA